MKQYIVDAFSDKLFGGNQAAVCVMDKWISDDLMQKIAIENNLSETAFTVPEKDGYRLRWFTPGGEIDFCGHATLGTAYVLLNIVHPEKTVQKFYAQVGELYVEKQGDLIRMTFPAYTPTPVDVTPLMEEVVGVKPLEAYMARDLMMVLDDSEYIEKFEPDHEKLKELEGVCIAVTAPGKDGVDSVSRVFAPSLGIKEDPVTGSTHCLLAPYWSNRLGKTELLCRQASARGGELYITCEGETVKVAGKAVLFAESELFV